MRRRECGRATRRVGGERRWRPQDEVVGGVGDDNVERVGGEEHIDEGDIEFFLSRAGEACAIARRSL
jgi:hypothetical protein